MDKIETMGFILNTVTLKTFPGAKNVLYPPLAFAKVLQVSRSGYVYDIVGTLPVNRQVRITFAGRVFQFATEFNLGETVTIKWTT